MSTTVRKLTPLKASAAVDQLNLLRLDLLKLSQGIVYHADASPAVTTATATADGYGSDGYSASAVTLANALKTAYAAHIASACDPVTGIGCHIVADATNVVTAPVATNLTTAVTLTTDLKAQFNAHIGTIGFHAIADFVNTISASNNGSEANLLTLVNEIKSRMNAHFAGAFTSQAMALVSP